jgi:acetylornithine/succinyldiaminopimelate/putrescine aminotransferase
VPGFSYITFGDSEALESAFKTAQGREAGQYAAFIIEPIQGEGGIIVPPAGYLKKVR